MSLLHRLPVARPALFAAVLALTAPDARAQCGALGIDEVLHVPSTTGLGTSVALSGDWLFAGATSSPDQIAGGGSVHVFQRTGAGWQPRALLTASDADEFDSFGASVAVSGTLAVVGAPNEDEACITFPTCGTGAVYFFELGPSGWVEVQKLTASDAGSGDRFGTSVAMAGDVAVIGADGPNGLPTHVYVIERTPAGWVETQKLSGHDTLPGDEFGHAFDLALGLLAVGAHEHDGALPRTGAVYIFQPGPTGWVERAMIEADVPVENARLGRSVSIFGDRMLAGAPGEPVSGSPANGAAYFFERVGSGWEQALRVADESFCFLSNFGQTVALGEDLAAVSSFCETYVFTPFDGGWVDIHLVPDVRLFDDRDLILAEPYDDTFGQNAGSIQIIGVPGASAFCTATPSSTGEPAHIVAEGCASISAAMLDLVASPVPNEPGFFSYSPTSAQAPFGNGFLCLGQPAFALPVVDAAGGALRHSLDYDSPPPAGAITAGSTWAFQATFRDRAAGGAFFDTSDGMWVEFTP